jgi:hypothetical protein
VSDNLELFAAEEQDHKTFRALSLWQPHAQAIALGIKLYETRSWSTSYRGPMVVHAAKKAFKHKDYPPEYFQEAGMRLSRAGCPVYALRYGEALCIVDLVDCVPTESIRSMDIGHRFWGDFTPGRFAFKLQNVRKIWPPIAVTGRQGFFSADIPNTNEALR